MNKAQPDELFTCVPVGHLHSPEGGIALDPDEQVRTSVSLVFAKFVELGSLTKTHEYLVANGIQLGLRVYQRARQRPMDLATAAAEYALRNAASPTLYQGLWPMPVHPTRKSVGQPKSGRRNAAPEEWICLLKGKAPAYISWEQYERNGRQRPRTRVEEGDGSRLHAT